VIKSEKKAITRPRSQRSTSGASSVPSTQDGDVTPDEDDLESRQSSRPSTNARTNVPRARARNELFKKVFTENPFPDNSTVESWISDIIDKYKDQYRNLPSKTILLQEWFHKPMTDINKRRGNLLASMKRELGVAIRMVPDDEIPDEFNSNLGRMR